MSLRRYAIDVMYAGRHILITHRGISPNTPISRPLDKVNRQQAFLSSSRHVVRAITRLQNIILSTYHQQAGRWCGDVGRRGQRKGIAAPPDTLHTSHTRLPTTTNITSYQPTQQGHAPRACARQHAYTTSMIPGRWPPATPRCVPRRVLREVGRRRSSHWGGGGGVPLHRPLNTASHIATGADTLYAITSRLHTLPVIHSQ